MLLLAFTVCCLQVLTLVASQSVLEVDALLALYNSTSGELWRWRSGPVWNFTRDFDGKFIDNPCSSIASNSAAAWQGITCSRSPQLCSNQTCSVIGITLVDYGLVGTIPSQIENLVYLRALNFNTNLLTGTIPEQVGNLTALTYLDLWTNLLSGPIPEEIGNCSALQWLYLLDNALTGNIPTEITSLVDLRRLYLGMSLLSGSIPREIGKLTLLKRFYVLDNDVTGSIPDDIGDLTLLERLYLYTNSLTGSIPPGVWKLTLLQELTLYQNSLTGSVHSEIGDLVSLSILYLFDNFFSGPMPDELGNMISLEYFDCAINALTGSVPKTVSNLINLEFFDFSNNIFTGSLPTEIGDLSSLFWFDFDNNLFTGSIPIEVTNLMNLVLIDLHNNMLTGSIPSDIGDMNQLQVIDVYNNIFTGSIPIAVTNILSMWFFDLSYNMIAGSIPSEIGYMTNLEQLFLGNNSIVGSIPKEISYLMSLNTLELSSNLLTGSIPSEIGDLTALSLLVIFNNALTGSIPRAISNLVNLVSLFVQSNKLIGSVENVFNSSSQVALEVIDMSDNQLSGRGVDSLFLLPSLKVLALSVNCFKNELSAGMCEAENIEVLSLNGLGAAWGCENNFRFPLSGVSLFNTIGGTVPDCVWNLRNLSVLHLTGNGLTGEIISQLPSYSEINDLSLSHNQLRGTIPRDVFDVKSLDLSYNKLSGTYAEGVHYATSSSVKLEVNRLSGHLPVSVLESGNVSSLNILRGNLFSCASVPDNDEFAQDKICGSENLNDAIYVLFSIFMICIMILLVCSLVMSSWFSFHTSSCLQYLRAEVNRLWVYRTYFNKAISRSQPDAAHLQKITAIIGNFKKTVNFFVVLLVTVLVTSVPIYSVRLSDACDAYSTHYYTYTWFWTLAYMRGVLPASLILISWIVVVTVSFYVLLMRETDLEIKLSPSDNQKSHNTESQTRGESSVRCLKSPVLVSVLAFVFNAVVTLVVNVLYIYSTQQALSASGHLGIQVTMAIFRLLYSTACVPVLSRGIKDTIANIDFRLQLLIVNNLIFPCIATAFASPSCFQGLLVPADAVSTPYQYEYCSTTDVENLMCINYSVKEVDSAPLIPPFTYTNQCASVILTSYIPVFILGYSMQFFLSFALPAVLIYLDTVVDIKVIAQSGLFDGILWPRFWLKTSDSELLNRNKFLLQSNPMLMLNTRAFFCFEVLNNLVVLLTFGLCSPILAFSVLFVAVLRSNLKLLLLGRFTRIVSGEDKESTHYSLIALGDLYTPVSDVCRRSFRIIAGSSAVFILLVSWDIATDAVGWLDSIWIPIVAISYFMVLWLLGFCKSPGRNRNERTEMELMRQSSTCSTANPIICY